MGCAPRIWPRVARAGSGGVRGAPVTPALGPGPEGAGRRCRWCARAGASVHAVCFVGSPEPSGPTRRVHHAPPSERWTAGAPLSREDLMSLFRRRPPGAEVTVTLGLVVALAVQNAVPPFATDMYSPAFPQVAADLATSSTAVGLTLTAFFLGMGLGQVVGGAVSDQRGRRIIDRPIGEDLARFLWLKAPVSMYEVHLASWRRPHDGRKFFNYRSWKGRPTNQGC